jgi:hypothetical protein
MSATEALNDGPSNGQAGAWPRTETVAEIARKSANAQFLRTLERN